jgi:hypothetical protein
MPKVIRTCARCGKSVTRNGSDFKSPIEKTYCNRSCRSFAIHKRRGIKGHPNFNGGKSVYRREALKKYGAKCSICGYNVVDVLEVHHKDGNRNNNNLDNLDVLCPTHHVEYEVGIRAY